MRRGVDFGQSLYEVEWKGRRVQGQARHSSKRQAQEFRTLQKNMGAAKSSELAARKWKGNTLSCVPGQLNQTVE